MSDGKLLIKSFLTEEEFDSLRNVEVHDRLKAEFEFNHKFNHMTNHQNVAEVKLYYKHTWQGWVLIKDEDMEEI